MGSSVELSWFIRSSFSKNRILDYSVMVWADGDLLSDDYQMNSFLIGFFTWKRSNTDQTKSSNCYCNFVAFSTHKPLILPDWNLDPQGLKRDVFYQGLVSVEVVCCMFHQPPMHLLDRNFWSSTALLVDSNTYVGNPYLMFLWNCEKGPEKQ